MPRKTEKYKLDSLIYVDFWIRYVIGSLSLICIPCIICVTICTIFMITAYVSSLSKNCLYIHAKSSDHAVISERLLSRFSHVSIENLASDARYHSVLCSQKIHICTLECILNYAYLFSTCFKQIEGVILPCMFLNNANLFSTDLNQI
jgi:hypothetical protein